jgi:hypothetical protein
MNLQEMIERNESFVGTRLDAAKAEQLAHLRDLCENIHRIEPLTAIDFWPVVHTSRNAMVLLRLPLPLFTADRRFTRALSALLGGADSVAFARVGGKRPRLQIACGVLDIWRED